MVQILWYIITLNHIQKFPIRIEYPIRFQYGQAKHHLISNHDFKWNQDFKSESWLTKHSLIISTVPIITYCYISLQKSTVSKKKGDFNKTINGRQKVLLIFSVIRFRTVRLFFYQYGCGWKALFFCKLCNSWYMFWMTRTIKKSGLLNYSVTKFVMQHIHTFLHACLHSSCKLVI